MRVFLPAILVLGMGLPALGGTEPRILRSIAEIKSLTEADLRVEHMVELKTTVLSELYSFVPQTRRLMVRDKTGSFFVENIRGESPIRGDVILLSAKTRFLPDIRQVSLLAISCRVLEHVSVSEPGISTARQIASGVENFNIVRLRGFIAEVWHDEIDANWNYLVLRQEDGERTYVAVPLVNITNGQLNALVDAEVELTGAVLPHYCAERMFVGPHLELWTKDCIRIVTPAPTDPFAAPYLPDIIHVSPTEFAKMRRQRIEGTVLAVWHGTKVLVREDSGRLTEVGLAPGQNRPKTGDQIQAVGFPGTDLFRLNLSRALCRTVRSADRPSDDTPTATGPKEILLDTNGNHRLDQSYYGKLIRLRGTVRSLPSSGIADGRMNLDCDGFLVPVDVSANPSVTDGLALGCEIEATGICIMEAENWRSDNLFPVLGGFTLVPRTPDDILILARPPWWTPGRLLVVICSLFAALLGILVWNRILNRLVERRSRQLFKEQVAHAGADLKVDERTRLAVELHDSLSQTLTGVSFQIDAAEKARQKDPSRIARHLALAKRTLLSCREELRNCLWDLRNNALEDADAVSAIRRTVEPHVGDATLEIDFSVPRDKISDNTFHAILCILRELAANAVRHGKARRISIRGGRNGEQLSFSVTDDGCGFDPASRPGMDEGHFGLLGITERLDTLGGQLDIDSTPGKGTVVRFSMET